MNIKTTDSFFTIGASHKKCEDYALHGNNYIIVCDGCSSSKDSDFGARFIAKSIAKNFDNLSKIPDDGSYYRAVESSIYAAQSACDVLGMSDGCLDATILAVIANKSNIHVFVIGDGNIAVKYKGEYVESINTDRPYNMQGLCEFTNIDFESNAPKYLSYILNENRLKHYNKVFQDDVVMHKKFYVNDKGVHIGTEYNNNDKPIIFEKTFITKDVEWIAVFSDGADTFNSVDLLDVLKNMTGFKNTKGACLERRMKRYIKDLAKKGITHTDDMSGAVIVFEDDE